MWLKRPITGLVAVVGILAYIRKRLVMRKIDYMHVNGHDEPDLDAQRELEERLREEARRYEDDLRELAKT